MVNSPWHRLPWSKAQGELTIDLQDGCCAFFAILNLHVAPMPPTKFWLNLTYHSGADNVWKFSRWPDDHLGATSDNISIQIKVWEMSFEEF